MIERKISRSPFLPTGADNICHGDHANATWRSIRPIDRASPAEPVDGETLGWILSAQPRLAMHLPDDEEAWEVRVYSISRFGVGFTSTEPFLPGSEHRLRIGRGPEKRSRLIRIVACHRSDAGTYAIGAEFVDLPARDLARAG